MLEALPAASLTRLILAHTEDDWSYETHSDTPWAVHRPRVAAAIARLNSLQELELYERSSLSDSQTTAVPAGIDCYAYGGLNDASLAAISRLSSLTQLRLESTAPGTDVTLLPAQLLQLTLSAGCRSEHRRSSELLLSLLHLTHLQQLDLTVSGRPGAGLSRPGQLTSLAVCARGDEAGTDVQHLGISALQQLQELELTDALFQAEQLQQLTCLTKLQQLSLMYTSAAKARSAAPAWRQLSCLHSLEIRDCRAELSMEEGQQLLAAVGAATSLVELDLSADGSLLDEETDICSYFTGLQRLTCLCLDSINGPHEKTDTPQLTKLTRLAELRIRGAWGIDDAAATAIARSLTQLTALQLQDCLITNRAVLQAIARLPLLEWLDLSGNAEALDDGSCLQDEDIEVLLPLPNLMYFEAAGTFW
ncbi:hypothetical protein OEZ86_012472 [Tetradesmus obliquus]|nr:hypothetical protein OEZ86_012472 [Tetradesmus obliquus]